MRKLTKRIRKQLINKISENAKKMVDISHEGLSPDVLQRIEDLIDENTMLLKILANND